LSGRAFVELINDFFTIEQKVTRRISYFAEDVTFQKKRQTKGAGLAD